MKEKMAHITFLLKIKMADGNICHFITI